MQNENSSSRDRVNLLLVDDHDANIVALSAILSEPNYNIVTALSGRQALNALLEVEFALVVLDVMMPEMDGYQVASRMKEHQRTQDVPIIFLTAGATDVSQIFKGYGAGAVDYLLKPIEPEILKAKVAVFVDLFRSKQRIKQQAEALREIERQESEAWFSTTLRSIGDAVMATDTTGSIRFINPVAESLTGWKYEEAHGKPFEDVFKIIDEESRGAIENPAAKIIREGTMVGIGNHTVLLGKSGKEFIIENSGAPIRNEQGALLGVVIVFRDATEARRAARRRNFISKAGSVLLSSLDYTATLNSVARLAVASVADCCCVDMTADGGRLERIALAHRDPEKEKKIREKAGLMAFASRVVGSGKSEIVFGASDSVICVPLSMREECLGAMTFFSGEARPRFTSEDLLMTEELGARVSTAIENARLYDEAQKAIRLRDEFLSIASHELRTPITPLKLQLQMLKRLLAKDALASYPAHKIEQLFNIADRQMARFQKLIEELLDVSRISVGRLTLEREAFDLAEVVQEIVHQFAGELEKARCQLELEVASAMGVWDKLRVEQVLMNLLANAMKYGAGKPIKILLESANGVARLRVQDHGRGIAKEDQARIFNRFERAASTRDFPGLGLGLYITRQILEAHGGSIKVESEPEKGATFIVELPLRAASS